MRRSCFETAFTIADNPGPVRFPCCEKRGKAPLLRFDLAATAAVIVTATAAGVSAPSVSAAAEDNDDEQDDPATITAPTIVPTTHRTSPHSLFDGSGKSPLPPSATSYVFAFP